MQSSLFNNCLPIKIRFFHYSLVPKKEMNQQLGKYGDRLPLDSKRKQQRHLKSNECQICSGQLLLIGKLGFVKHFQCRHCGMSFSKKPKKNRDSFVGEAGA